MGRGKVRLLLNNQTKFVCGAFPLGPPNERQGQIVTGFPEFRVQAQSDAKGGNGTGKVLLLREAETD